MQEKANMVGTLQASIKSGFAVGFVVAIVVTAISINMNFLWNNFHDFLIVLLFALAIKTALWSLIGLFVGILIYLFGRISNWPFIANNKNKITLFIIFHAAFLLYGFMNIVSPANAAQIFRINLTFILAIAYMGLISLVILLRRPLLPENAAGLNRILLSFGILLLIFISGMWVANRIYSSERTPFSISSQPSKVKLLVIGVDAAGWDMVSQLLDGKKLPHIDSLMRNGAYGELETIRPTSSPVIWTTIATGKNYNKHGVSNFVKYRLANCYYSISIPPGFGIGTVLKHLSWWTDGRLCEPIATSGRSVKTSLLWEILNMAQKDVGVFGWWCTWPIRPVNGYMVSDYYDELLLEENDSTTTYQTTYPPDLARQLEPYIKPIEEKATNDLTNFINMSEKEINYILSTPKHPQNEAFRQLKHVYFEDLIQKQAATFVLRNTSPELVCIYFRGVDIAGHYFWKHCHPTEYNYEIEQSEIEAFGKTIENYYMFIDKAIGEILTITNEEYATMIISDHRMGPVNVDDPGAPRSGGHGKPIAGIFLFDGTPFRSQSATEAASVLDITPTILQIFGLPQARDFDGRILTELLSSQFRVQVPGSAIESYDRDIKPIGDEKSPIDKEIKERLRGLGYIQ